jgi:hypothetical protein
MVWTPNGSSTSKTSHVHDVVAVKVHEHDYVDGNGNVNEARRALL